MIHSLEFFFAGSSYNYHLFLPEFFLFFAISAYVLYFVLLGDPRDRTSLAPYGALLVATLALILSWAQGGLWARCGSLLDLVESNPLIQLWKLASLVLLVLALAFLVRVGGRDRRFDYEYLFLVLSYGLAGLTFLGSADLVTFYLAAELQSFSMYILVSYHRVTTHSIESGLKYFVLGSVVSSLMLLGSALLYLAAGTTNFQALAHFFFLAAAPTPLALVGSWLLLAGLLFKISAFPFHFWAPDVYQGTSYGLVFLLAVLSKLGGFVLLMRIIFGPLADLLGGLQPLLFLAGLGSVVLGTFLSLRPHSLKRFLAYSSMVHVGFVTLTAAAGTLDGLYAAFLYVAAYLTLSSLLLGTLLLFDSPRPRTFADLPALAIRSPALALAFALGSVSMAGIPPFLGFLPKFQSFLVFLGEGYLALTLVLMGLSVVSAFYYFRLVFAAAYDDGALPAIRALLAHPPASLRFPAGPFLAFSLYVQVLYFTFYDSLASALASALGFLFY